MTAFATNRCDAKKFRAHGENDGLRAWRKRTENETVVYKGPDFLK